VLLTTCEPPVRLKVFAFSKMLPALPAPTVSTEIFPPSAIANVGTGAVPGAVTVISPAFPVLDAVLNNPLGPLPLPETETELAAVTVKFPPSPAPVVLLTTCAPPV
jgi:hypothetical protein